MSPRKSDSGGVLSDFTSTNEWQQLLVRAERPVNLRNVFEVDPTRASRLTIEVGDLIVDLSKHLVDEDILATLVAMADRSGLRERIEAMFNGEHINTTEDRAVLHTLLRTPRDELDVDTLEPALASVHETLDRMAAFAEDVRLGKWVGHTGARIRDVVNIGIGGSDLGPAMAYRALRAQRHPEIKVHYVSNIDPSHLVGTLTDLDPATTLFVVASKTFTTIETLTNAQAARQWLVDRSGNEDSVAKHFVAVSSNQQLVGEFGIEASNMFAFGDWVGGRYSLGSAIGLSLMIAIGPSAFREMLGGFRTMDVHFRETPIEKNVPALMALIGIFYRNAMELTSYAVLPYAQDLDRFPAYLQQLDMESNGKRTRISGVEVDLDTGPVLWGEPGTNGQHAFYQLLHQGTSIVPADLIGFVESNDELGAQQDLLVANMFAQAEALAFGRSETEVLERDPGMGPDLVPHRAFPGNRPTTVLLAQRLTPSVLGQLIALYEHKVFVQGALWDINSFDQWGVELGKQLAEKVFAELTSAQTPDLAHDGSTNQLITFYRKARRRL